MKQIHARSQIALITSVVLVVSACGQNAHVVKKAQPAATTAASQTAGSVSWEAKAATIQECPQTGHG
ncbi:MAG TPA: hypothetical protein VM598_03425, partial [Bdellovibrionota bacterium]|nr:hypothetical protein [Bdellovibrionota bacterium]